LSGNYRIPTQVDIDNLNRWINIWDRSRDYRSSSIYSSLDRFSGDIGGSINIIERSIKEGFGDRLENIATSVYEVYIASFFDIEYEFDISPIDELFNRGFVPTFDGYTWRLISGVDLKVVFSQHVAWSSIRVS